jgi:assimilatory nitrate reductase catalytic subunit
MSRTRLSPRLARHRDAPYVEIHPEDAERYRLSDGGFAEVTSSHGVARLRVVVTSAQRPGVLFAPIHWSDATAGRARIGALTHAIVDPVSGQPDSKATPARTVPLRVASEGFVVARRPLAPPSWLVHARMAIPDGEATTFAATQTPAVLHAYLSNWLGLEAAPATRLDEGAQTQQSASLVDDRLDVLLWTGPKLDRAALDWAIDLLAREKIEKSMRRFVLASRPLGDVANVSPLVCACFGVSQNVIRAAIAQGARDVEAIGRATRAGTNCGSCRAEIRQILLEPTSSPLGA